MDISVVVLFFGILIVMFGVGVLVLVLFRKQSKPTVNANAFLNAIDFTNIRDIRFVRNKIVIDCLNVDFFDAQALKDAGANGITIVGDTVKFFINGTPETNQTLYQILHNTLKEQ